MTISALAKDLTYVLGNNNSNIRGSRICKITPHHAAGVVANEAGVISIAKYWKSKGNASANYFIDVAGNIYCTVNEDRRAWTSANAPNDQQAVTFEMSNDINRTPWTISEATINAAARLSADICTRYGITPKYTGNKEASITIHRMFVSTECPGDWFIRNYLQNGKFASLITMFMLESGGNVQLALEPKYYVQIGAYKRRMNAYAQAQTLQGFAVYDIDGLYKVRQYFMTGDEANEGLKTAQTKYKKAFIGKDA